MPARGCTQTAGGLGFFCRLQSLLLPPAHARTNRQPAYTPHTNAHAVIGAYLVLALTKLGRLSAGRSVNQQGYTGPASILGVERPREDLEAATLVFFVLKQRVHHFFPRGLVEAMPWGVIDAEYTARMLK